MPSPLGHALAGLSLGIATDPQAAPVRRSLRSFLTPFALWSAVLAAGPDVDLLLHNTVIPKFHRTATHSLTAVVAVFILTMVVTGKVTRWSRRLMTATVCALAWSSHLLMDWLGADPSTPSGIQLFWPFSERFYISNLDFFPATERSLHASHFLVQNLRAATVELCTGGVLIALAVYVHGRRAAGRAARGRVTTR